MSDVAIVGDVHGNAGALARALEWLAGWPGEIVFVGDYVNRGPDSKSVLDLLVEASTRWGERLTLLLGNHDLVLLNFLRGEDPTSFIRHGGLQTIRSYLGESVGLDPIETFRQTFPPAHYDLLCAMPVVHETSELLVSHTGFNPAQPNSRAPEDVTLGAFPELFAGVTSAPRTLVVCGHYVQRSWKPFVSERFICVDSGCGTDPAAPLSVLVLPSRSILSFYGAS